MALRLHTGPRTLDRRLDREEQGPRGKHTPGFCELNQANTQLKPTRRALTAL